MLLNGTSPCRTSYCHNSNWLETRKVCGKGTIDTTIGVERQWPARRGVVAHVCYIRTIASIRHGPRERRYSSMTCRAGPADGTCPFLLILGFTRRTAGRDMGAGGATEPFQGRAIPSTRCTSGRVRSANKVVCAVATGYRGLLKGIRRGTHHPARFARRHHWRRFQSGERGGHQDIVTDHTARDMALRPPRRSVAILAHAPLSSGLCVGCVLAGLPVVLHLERSGLPASGCTRPLSARHR